MVNKIQARRTSTVAGFFMVGKAEAVERIARVAKRVLMNFILIDVIFLYSLMVEERRAVMLRI